MKRHVTCFVEKAGFEPKTLGTKAECYDPCATRPVRISFTPVTDACTARRRNLYTNLYTNVYTNERKAGSALARAHKSEQARFRTCA